jgi:hypothetical protein
MLRLDNFEFFRDTHAPRATIAEARRLIDVPPTSSFSREASGNSSTLVDQSQTHTSTQLRRADYTQAGPSNTG